MEEKILQGILDELKGLRHDTNKRFTSLENKVAETNQRLDSLENRVGETNQRLDSLENKVGETNQRLGVLEQRFEGLKSSIEVLQVGVNQVRYELLAIKEILGDKVIWQNETVTFEVRDGTKLYGVIHKGEKK